jgi:hypothetical protein
MVQLFNKTIVIYKQTTFVAKEVAFENSQNLENTYRPEFLWLSSKGNGILQSSHPPFFSPVALQPNFGPWSSP